MRQQVEQRTVVRSMIFENSQFHIGRRCCTLICVAVFVCAPGCKVVGLFFPSDSIELAGDQDVPAPIDSVSTRGLEVRLWVVDDTYWSASRALLPYVEAGSSDESIERWADWGFRLVRVPIQDVQGVLDSLRPVQPINTQWLGEFGQWRAIVRAGELQTSRVRVGDHSVSIERGRPRLIARSWVEPMLTEDAVIPAVRLDLAMQIETKKRSNASALYQIDRERMIEDEGPILDELIRSSMMDGSYALVLVGEAPGFDWGSLPEDIGEISIQESNDSDEFGPGEESDESTQGERDQSEQQIERTTIAEKPIGSRPEQPSGQSLGEQMLTGGGSRIIRLNESRTIPKRVVVVLIPRVDGGYSLLPRVANMVEQP